MPKILLLIDKPNWAYHSIAKALVKYNTNKDLSLSIMPIKANVDNIKKKYKKFDSVLVMGWQTYEHVSFLPKHITMVGIHSFHAWDNRSTTPEKDEIPPRQIVDYLSSFKSVNAVSQRLSDAFINQGLNVVYTPNGVDTNIFVRTKNPPISKSLIVGYSGSKAHDWRKGVSEFILPAAKKAGVEVKIAMLSTDSYVPLEEMYKFYNEIDCYVCASSSEGMSLSVLEAASCGRPIITTRVSGNTEVIKENITGFFVDRTLDDICEKLNCFKDKHLLTQMSNNIFADIRNHWCWSNRTKNWIDFLVK